MVCTIVGPWRNYAIAAGLKYFSHKQLAVPRVRLEGQTIFAPRNYSIKYGNLFHIAGIRPENSPKFDLHGGREVAVQPIQMRLLREGGEVVPVNDHLHVTSFVIENAWRRNTLNKPRFYK